MTNVLTRLAIVGLLGATGIVTEVWGDNEVPGGPGILGMKCQTVNNCGGQTQVEDCLQKEQGAGCTFCTGSGSLKMCVTGDPNDRCSSSRSPGCGTRVSGSCKGGSSGPDSGGPLICTGNQVVGSCSVAGC